MKKVLQVKINNQWEYVFCRNEKTGIVTTKHRNLAIPANENSIKYFMNSYGNKEFRII